MAIATSRRDFAKGFAALAVALAGTDLFAGPVLPAVPPYYDAVLAAAVAKVNRHLAEDGCTSSFWFVTDLHILHNCRNSGFVLANLVARTPVKRVFCGGDLPVAFGTAADLESIVHGLWPKHWREPLEAAGATLCLAKGNHDFHITDKTSGRRDFGFMYSAAEAAAELRRCNGNAAGVTDADDPSACHFHFDVADERMRYVFANTSDCPSARGESTSVKGGHVQMSERQLKWLARTALGTVPAGYSVVLVHHVPLAPTVASGPLPESLKVFSGLLEAYQRRQAIEIGGECFDFSGRRGGDILLDLTGHHHSDRQGYSGGILHVSESCDARYRDYIRRTPFSGVLPEKKPGTAVEQTFDCVQLNPEKGLVYITRLGGGQDRVYHTRPVVLGVGGTHRFRPETLTAGDWKAFDCDRAKFDRTAPTAAEAWAFRNEHGTVSSDGTFTAAWAGPAMVVAMDRDLRKEFFPVAVLTRPAEGVTWESNRVLEKEVSALERERNDLRRRVASRRKTVEELDRTADLVRDGN